MLVLFDIDGTLLTTNGRGIEALVAAGRELFGETFTREGVDVAGRLDPLIIVDLLARNGVAVTDEHVQAMREGYGRHLLRERDGAATPWRALAGAAELVDAVEAVSEITLGLLTGNYPETGEFKLSSVGLEPSRFSIQVWGCDSPQTPPSRNHLPAVGMERYEAAMRRSRGSYDVVIIGDTPHDVECARAHGCRVLAVATGRYSTMELSGADLCVETLVDTDTILSWLVGDAVWNRR